MRFQARKTRPLYCSGPTLQQEKVDPRRFVQTQVHGKRVLNVFQAPRSRRRKWLRGASWRFCDTRRERDLASRSDLPPGPSGFLLALYTDYSGGRGYPRRIASPRCLFNALYLIIVFVCLREILSRQLLRTHTQKSPVAEGATLEERRPSTHVPLAHQERPSPCVTI